MTRHATVVIPAHDAAGTIEACLDSLAGEAVEIIVVANGCTDATAQIARSHRVAPAVIEVDRADKANALNVGDRAARGFPRLYVDADVVFAPGAVGALIRAVGPDTPAAAPAARIATAGSTAPVRSYFAIWQRLGVVVTGLCGAGVYVLSDRGRARFDRFPDLAADDLFVDQRFARSERVRVPPGVTYRAPTDTRALVARKARAFAGNRQLRRNGPPCHPRRDAGRGWIGVVADDPRLIVHLPAYVTITLMAKCRALFAGRSALRQWST